MPHSISYHLLQFRSRARQTFVWTLENCDLVRHGEPFEYRAIRQRPTLVENALRCIPWRFRRRMKNVAIVGEQEPPRPGLLGLYQGRPLANRSVFEGFTMPDKIRIFQCPHERLSHT